MSVVYCTQGDPTQCRSGCARVPANTTGVGLPTQESEVFSPASTESNHVFLQRLPFLACLIITLISAIWILLAEVILSSVSGFGTPHLYQSLLKGAAYTVLAAGLMYGLLKWSLQRPLAEQIVAQRNAERLLIALTATKSGVWEWHFATRKLYLSEHLAVLLDETLKVPPTWGLLTERIHPEDRTLFGNIICRTLQSPNEEHSAQYRVLRHDGIYAWLEVRGRMLLDPKGRPMRVVGVATDISHTKEKDSHIERLTYFDSLTGLPNRAKFMNTLHGKMEQRKSSGTFLLVARLDINRFQDINNVHGAAVGDQLLTLLGHRLEYAAGRRGIVSRFAGDDFAIAVSALASAEEAQELAGAISQVANQPVELNGDKILLSTVMGAAISPNDGEVTDKLVSYAELALVQARDDGQMLGFYELGMNEAFRERAHLEHALSAALHTGGLSVVYQPVVRTLDQSLVGFEALTRWSHPELGAISPAKFVPLAEATGLIGELGRFVLRSACTQAASWNRSSAVPIMIAVNVSARQMDDDCFVEEVAAVLAETGLPADCLELEVTESVIMSDVEAMSSRLQRLRELGVHVAVDDFGTGYSSLAVLKQLPVSKLKVDRSFVQDLNASEEGDAIVAAILELAQSMNLSVTAEGVETQEQLEFLRARKCQTIQGYLISKPLPPEALQPFLADYAAA